jgi:hypothetical protein
LDLVNKTQRQQKPNVDKAQQPKHADAHFPNPLPRPVSIIYPQVIHGRCLGLTTEAAEAFIFAALFSPTHTFTEGVANIAQGEAVSVRVN